MQGRAHEERLESNSLLAFFGISIVLQNGAALLFTNNTRAYRYFDQVITLGPMSMTGNRLLTLVISTFLALATAAYLRFTLFGLATRAVIQNRDASSIVGIELPRMQIREPVLGYGLRVRRRGRSAGQHDRADLALHGFPVQHRGVSRDHARRARQLLGGIAAGVLLGVHRNLRARHTSAPNYRSLLVYGVFVLMMMLRPRGLVW